MRNGDVTPYSGAGYSGHVESIHTGGRGASFNKRLNIYLAEHYLDSSDVVQLTRFWSSGNYVECLRVMSDLKPWEEWYSSPWGLIFDDMLIRSDFVSTFEHSGIVLPASFWERLVRRALSPEIHFGRVSGLVELESARPFLLEWLGNNFVNVNSDLINVINTVINVHELHNEEFEILWRIVSQAEYDSVNGLSRRSTKEYLCYSLIAKRGFPVWLVREFLIDLEPGMFSWRILAVLVREETYHHLVEEFGGVERLAEMVNSSAGNWNATVSPHLPNRLRALAALEGYDKLAASFKLTLNFDLKAETILLLREEAERAGMTADLPVSFLLETLWEVGSPGWFYITGEKKGFQV